MSIIVVALDLVKNAEAVNYADLSVEEKVEHIVKLIKKSYKKAKKKDPNALVVVAWREYGIYDPDGIKDHVISHIQKNEMKAALAAVTQDKDDLVVIAGTVASSKPSDEIGNLPDKIKIMESFYQDYYFIHELELESKISDDLKFSQEKNRFEGNKEKLFTAIGNKSFLFYKGQQIAKREKVSPFEETPEGGYVYRCSKDFSLVYLDDHGNRVPVAIEICHEHYLGVLRHLMNKNKLEQPLIQFVLSDSTPLKDENLCGKFIVHIDSKYGVNFIFNADDHLYNDVKVYKVNPYEDDVSLERVFSSKNFTEIKKYLNIVKERAEMSRKNFASKSICLAECEMIMREIANLEGQIEIAEKNHAEFDQGKAFDKMGDMLIGCAHLLNAKINHACAGEGDIAVLMTQEIEFVKTLVELVNVESILNKAFKLERSSGHSHSMLK